MHYDQLLSDIGKATESTQTLAARSINQILTLRNWLIGAYIVEFEQNGLDRAAYGDQLLKRLASDLNAREVKGFSLSNLKNYRLFALEYAAIVETSLPRIFLSFQGNISFPPISQTVSGQFGFSEQGSQDVPIQAKETHAKATIEVFASLKVRVEKNPPLTWQDSAYWERLLSSLSWSHLVQLLQVDNSLKRAFYEVECMKSQWSVRDLKRQMDTALFERVGLSKDKDGVMALAQQGKMIASPEAVLRDPYVFEFLGLEERSHFSEAALEKTLIDHLQQFMRELGRDFCFVDRQYRIAVGSEVYHLDLLFYHRKLRCLVAIDLKLGSFKHEYAGQMNFYLNYLRHEQTYEDENPPIGLLLCTEKDETVVQYATGGMDNQLFVSKYQSALPSIAQLQHWLRQEKEYLLQLAEAKEEKE
jgi:predicted nuclease of restriction endonuclease-like (RecB) superfamily